MFRESFPLAGGGKYRTDATSNREMAKKLWRRISLEGDLAGCKGFIGPTGKRWAPGPGQIPGPV
jgi:hypothetical protein